ncbi:hypothetical protein ACWCRF_14085 [Streptomyces sp. NPDC002405]
MPTVLAWAGRFCYAACHTGLDALAGICAGTVAGGDVHAVVGRPFAAATSWAGQGCTR